MNNQKLAALASAAAIALATPVIVYYEGTRLEVYRDPIGILTGCTGHTGYDVKAGHTYTHQECADILTRDLTEHDAGLTSCIKAPLPPNVHAAMLSFTFNVGVSKFCNSTVAKRLNAGDIMGACAELSRWVYAGGKKLLGLERRRATERELCEGRPT